MYCKYCGKEVNDNAVICVGCGRLTDKGEAWQKQQTQQQVQPNNHVVKNNSNNSALGTTAKVFMILGCIFTPFELCSSLLDSLWAVDVYVNFPFILIISLASLAWTLPLTISVCRKLKDNEPIGTGLKVCTLIFVNTIAGILLFCIRNEEKPSGAVSVNTDKNSNYNVSNNVNNVPSNETTNNNPTNTDDTNINI